MSQAAKLWARYKQWLSVAPAVGLSLDISRMRFDDAFFTRMEEPLRRAFAEMDELERGGIANRDEGRMVGHYWLRDPSRAPRPEIRDSIVSEIARVKAFAADVHAGRVKPEKAPRFRKLLVIGIGGSALGPQLVASALGTENDPLEPFYFDNTDPDGMDRVLARIGNQLAETLVLVVSKSGTTKETRNGMIEAQAAYERAGLRFAAHAVAVTGEGSELYRHAKRERFLTTFPMWDWIGGRTSVTSVVGLLPAALQGIDIDAFLAGARDMDAVTRVHDPVRNPAALLAAMWHYAGEGRGTKNMVVLPYKDRLELFGRYLQQLVMESLGKERDLDGKVVHQGLTVYGNKGSTDQHAYVQQLREGPNDFFATFVEVLADRKGPSIEVDDGITSGDYLLGFLLGTREALYENGRDSMTITLRELSPRSLAALIALYERAVGLYASLIRVNAYHQPGVEAGKKAAGAVLELQRKVVKALDAATHPLSLEEVAQAAGEPEAIETVLKILEHLVANGRGIVRTGGSNPFDGRYASASTTPRS